VNFRNVADTRRTAIRVNEQQAYDFAGSPSPNALQSTARQGSKAQANGTSYFFHW
jgi:hypothetical protein